jgi:thiamine biosynthesis lipoprotein
MVFRRAPAVFLLNQDRPTFLESYSQGGSGLERFEARAMGTRNVLLLGGAEPGLLRKAAQEAFDALGRLEGALSKFLPASEVSLVNALAAERPVPVGRDLLHLLVCAREAWEITGGAFDPTVGALMEAWGLVDLEGRIPPKAEIDALLERRGMNHVLLEAPSSTVSFDGPGVSLDLGGMGKGHALDVVAGMLKARGIPVGAVISGRSSILTWGTAAGEDRWRFEVVDPRDPGETLRVLRVEPGAVSSSGAYERFFRRRGKTYGHVLDPRTGLPARGVLGVTVWTETALLGDVISTALFVLGREGCRPGGPAERLVRAWSPAEARASVLLAEEDTSAWGGLRIEEFHYGRRAFEAETG